MAQIEPPPTELPLVVRLATGVALTAMVLRLWEISRRSRRPIATWLGELFPAQRAKSAIWGLAAGLSAVAAPWLACSVSGALEARFQTPGAGFVLGAATTLLLKAVMVVCEELVFRGCLLPLLLRPLRPAGAILATALLFSLVHTARNSATSLLLAIDGVGLGVAFVVGGGLWAPVGWHLARNTALWLLYGHTSLQLAPGLFASTATGTSPWVGPPGQAGLADLLGSLAALAIVLLAGWRRTVRAGLGAADRGTSNRDQLAC